jgi:hypothetical protein
VVEWLRSAGFPAEEGQVSPALEAYHEELIENSDIRRPRSRNRPESRLPNSRNWCMTQLRWANLEEI